MLLESNKVADHFATIPLPDSIDHLTGPLPFCLTNDVLFHILFETSNKALRGLLCSLLRLQDNDIRSIEIQNPIQFGQTVLSKEFILDLKLLLNNNTSINVEMQVLKFQHWTERSLSYLCRSYDKLNKGTSYADTKAAIHIGILDYDLFPEEETRFYTTYHLADDVTHKIYTGKFQLSVLYLNHVDKATKEDLAYHLDYWARFFKATTWEELKMLAEKSPVFTEAAKTIYNATEDVYARTMLEAYEEGAKLTQTLKDEFAIAYANQHAAIIEQKEALAQQQALLIAQEAELAQQNSKIIEQKAELAQQNSKIIEQKAELAQQNSKIIEQKAELDEKNSEIDRLRAELAALKANQ